MKQCNGCNQGKEESKFSKRKDTKDKLQIRCKECQKKRHKQWYEGNKKHKLGKSKEWYENNRDYRLEKGKEGRENNKEHRRQKSKEGYENNREEILERQRNNLKNRERHKNYISSPLIYNSKAKVRKEIEKYEEIRKSVNGNIEVKCAYCGGGFEPKKGEIYHRIYAIEGKSEGEQRLYCSDKCKENCPIYKQIRHPKDQKPATSREVQPQLRQLVFKRDNYTCQKCGYHRDELEVGIHCHHMEGIKQNPVESADEDICITYCEECHDKAHDQPGCRYHELKCSG